MASTSAQPNDRLPLGMNGTMSEMELSLLRQRSLEALKQKAGRGERATCGAATTALKKTRIGASARRLRSSSPSFTEMQSVRQVHLWLTPARSVARHREGERHDRGDLDEAAVALSVSPSTVRRLINDEQLAATSYATGHLGSSKQPILSLLTSNEPPPRGRLRRPPTGTPL